MPEGYLSLVLHAHLPYVRHKDEDHFIQERWFFEALTECYLPLVDHLNQINDDGLFFRLTLSISPPLAAMFSDDLLSKKFIRYLDNLHSLADAEIQRTKNEPQFNSLAHMYRDRFERVYKIYNKYDRNMLNAFKQLQGYGCVELITSGATHGYFPLLSEQPETVRAQIQQAIQFHEENFGSRPPGFWLPECGYYPGVDQYLASEGIKYYFVDSHGLLFARPRPRYGTFAPIETPWGCSAFARDLETSKQVWSADDGYPGDYDYREYYRDIGYDLDWSYIKHFVYHNQPTHTGIKYYRITGKSDHKEPYNPSWAQNKAAIHADNFLFNRQCQAKHLNKDMERPPIIVSPYDAELFGHWWYEGPQWLDYLIRKTVCDQESIQLITPGDYLKLYPHNQEAVPCQSSWGNEGYSAVWLEQGNEWIYRHLHRAGRQMVSMVAELPNAKGWTKKALDQASRELMLAQASDWAFIMKTGTLVDYAQERTKKHLDNFSSIHNQVKSGRINKKWLNEIAEENNLFPTIDYRLYQ